MHLLFWIVWYFMLKAYAYFAKQQKNQDSWTALINFTQLLWGVNDSMRGVNQLCILLWMSIHHLQFNYFTIWECKDWVKVSKGWNLKIKLNFGNDKKKLKFNNVVLSFCLRSTKKNNHKMHRIWVQKIIFNLAR